MSTIKKNDSESTGFWGFIDNWFAQAIFATVITVAWLVWIFIEILGGNS